MKVEEIKKLQNEFNFISHINELMAGTVYQAVKDKHNYEITILSDPTTYRWTKTINEFNRLLLSGQYEIRTASIRHSIVERSNIQWI